MRACMRACVKHQMVSERQFCPFCFILHRNILINLKENVYYHFVILLPHLITSFKSSILGALCKSHCFVCDMPSVSCDLLRYYDDFGN